MRHFRIQLFAVLALALAAAAPARAEVLIGLAVPLTGPYAWTGVDHQGGRRDRCRRPQCQGRRAGPADRRDRSRRLLRWRSGRGRRQQAGGGRRGRGFWPPVLGCRDPGLEGLCRRQDPDDLAWRHQSEADRAGLHQRVPHGGPGRRSRPDRRRSSRRALGQQADRHRPRWPDLWQGPRRGDQETAQPAGYHRGHVRKRSSRARPTTGTSCRRCGRRGFEFSTTAVIRKRRR